MRLLIWLGKVVLYLALVFAGAMLSFMSSERPMPRVDESNLPRDFPVFAAWSDGGSNFCQAFHAGEIESLRQAHASMSFGVANPDDCARAISHFERNGAKWPVQFDWQMASRWPHIPYSIDRRADGSVDVELSYREDDDDYNKSRYRVRDGKIVEAWHQTGYGPALGVAPALSGIGLALLVFLATRVYRAARARSGTGSDRIKP